jgi:HEAT repeats
MARRRRRLLIGLAVLALGGVLALPGVHWRLVGWAKGEPLYHGRPVSYWRPRVLNGGMAVMKGRPEVVIFFDRPPPSILDWAGSYLLGRPLYPGRHMPPIPAGDPEAAPLLTTLLADPSPLVRFYAAQSLGELGGAARPAVPALRSLTDDRAAIGTGLTVARAATEALRKIDPDAPKEAADRPDGVPLA